MQRLIHVLALITIICVAMITPGCATTNQNTHTISQQSSRMTMPNTVNVENRTNTAAVIGFGVGAALGVGLITMALIGLPAAMASSFCVG